MENQDKTCGVCRHFCRHYVRLSKNKYMPLDEGHCTEPRCRDKKVDTPACWRHSQRKEAEQER